MLWRHVAQVAGPELLPAVAEWFGLAFLRGVTVFTLVDVVNELGMGAFEDGRIGLATLRLRELFRAADPGGTAVAFRHSAYQEVLAADVLRTRKGRQVAAAAGRPRPRLTGQVREFPTARGSSPRAPATACCPPVSTWSALLTT